MKYWKLLLTLSFSFYYTICFGQQYSSTLLNNWPIVVKNERIFQRYTKCIFDQGPCTNEGQNLKTILKDFFENQCSSCSTQEKIIAGKILKFIKINKPDVWDQILDKYGSEEQIEFLESFFADEKCTER